MLSALGLAPVEADASIRSSFGQLTTEDEVLAAVAALSDVLESAAESWA